MKILHVTPAYSPSIGGIESVVENLSRGLNQRGMVSDVVHVGTKVAAGSCQTDAGVLFRIPLQGNRYLGYAKGLHNLASTYDVVHVHDPQLSALSLNLPKFKVGKPALVLSTHGGFFHTKRFGSLKYLHWNLTAVRIIKRYRLVMATSQQDYETFKNVTKDIVVVENGIDFEKFSSFSAAKHRDPYHFLYWGRFSKNKRVPLLIEYIAKLRNAGLPITLSILGRGDYSETAEIEHAIRSHRVESFIRLKTSPSDCELADVISKAGVFITATEYEGFGLSILEALASGLPVLCENLPPMNRFVSTGRTGAFINFQVEIYSPKISEIKEFCEPSPNILEETRRACVESAREFSWTERCKHFEQCYQAALT